jgi:hypothetical protein
MALQPTLPGLAPPCRPEPARTARAALARYPDVDPDDLCTHAKVLGLAGEHLVDCVLAMLGERAIPTPEHEQFDRIVWLDQRLLRVQIKTRNVPSAGGYVFNVRRGYQRGPFGTRPYDPQDFDMLALVALPEFVVKFTADWRPSHVVTLAEIPRLRRQPRASLDTALHDLGLADAVPHKCPDTIPGTAA